jgi:hypothetical protein
VLWEGSFGIVIIEAIAYGTPVVVHGGAVRKVVAGVSDPAACRRSAARNIGVEQFGSGYERSDRGVRKVAGSHVMMRHVVKSVEPQLKRVGRVDQRGTA